MQASSSLNMAKITKRSRSFGPQPSLDAGQCCELWVYELMTASSAHFMHSAETCIHRGNQWRRQLVTLHWIQNRLDPSAELQARRACKGPCCGLRCQFKLEGSEGWGSIKVRVWGFRTPGPGGLWCIGVLAYSKLSVPSSLKAFVYLCRGRFTSPIATMLTYPAT